MIYKSTRILSGDLCGKVENVVRSFLYFELRIRATHF